MSMSLDGLYSGYSDIYGTNNKKAEIDKLQNSINSTSSSSTEEELMEVCKEFEAYFVEQMYKSMEKLSTVPGGSDEDSSSTSDYMEMFGDTLTKEYATMTTEQGEGLGLAQMLYEQMKRNYGID